MLRWPVRSPDELRHDLCAQRFERHGHGGSPEAIFVLRGDEQLEMLFHRGAPKAISLLPVTRSRGVTTQGLKWELSGAELEPSFPFSVSNEARSDRIHVGLEKGILLVYVTRG